jgi:hypothetical protein
MKQFLTTLPRNLIGCFTRRMIIWHIVAILLTFILVMSGLNWRYFLATRSPALRSWMWSGKVLVQMRRAAASAALIYDSGRRRAVPPRIHFAGYCQTQSPSFSSNKVFPGTPSSSFSFQPTE